MTSFWTRGCWWPQVKPKMLPTSPRCRWLCPWATHQWHRPLTRRYFSSLQWLSLWQLRDVQSWEAPDPSPSYTHDNIYSCKKNVLRDRRLLTIIGGITLNVRKTSDFESRLGQNMGPMISATKHRCCIAVKPLTSWKLNNKPLIMCKIHQNSICSIRKSSKRYWLISCDRFSAMQVVSESDIHFANPQTLSAILWNIQVSLGLAALEIESQQWGVTPQASSHALWSIWSKGLEMGLPYPNPKPWLTMTNDSMTMVSLDEARNFPICLSPFWSAVANAFPEFSFSKSSPHHWHAEVHPTGRSIENYGDDENASYRPHGCTTSYELRPAHGTSQPETMFIPTKHPWRQALTAAAQLVQIF